MNLIKAIKINLSVLIKNPVFLFYKFYYYYFENLLLNRKRTVKFKFDKLVVNVPNEIIPILVLEEVFVFEVYRNLSNLDCILDLGAYLGESSVYLSSKNRKVLAFEPEPINYHFLKLNSIKLNKIQAYNLAVVNSNKKTSQFYKTENYDYGGNVSNFFNKKNQIVVNNKSISKIFQENPGIDGIKMDIEGGEFELLPFLMMNLEKYVLKKGYIEFHFFGKNKDNLNLLMDFIKLLNEKEYKFQIYDIYGNKLNSKLIIKKHKYLNSGEEFIFHFNFNKNER